MSSVGRLFGALVLAAPLTLASIVACSSSDEAKTDTNADAGNSCASSATYVECDVCCGGLILNEIPQKAFIDCVCDEACKTECAGSCDTGTSASAECEACSDADKTDQVCGPKASAACAADPECATQQECVRAADCSAKPDTVDGG